jgi:hypothetical protein
MPCDLSPLYSGLLAFGLFVLLLPFLALSLCATSYLLDRAGYDGPLSLGLSSRSTLPFSFTSSYMPSPTVGNYVAPSYEDFLWRVAEQQDYEEQVHRQVGIEWHHRYGVTKGASALDYRARSVDGVFVQLLPDDRDRYPVFVQPHEWDLPTQELVLTFMRRALPWQAELTARTRQCICYPTLGLPDPIIELPIHLSLQWKELWEATSIRQALYRLNDGVQPRLAAQEAWVCMYRQALAENDAIRVPHRHLLDPWRNEPLYRLRRDAHRRILEVSHIYAEPAIRDGLKTYHRLKHALWKEIAKRPELRQVYEASPIHSHERSVWSRLVKEHDVPHIRHQCVSDDEDDGDDDEDDADSAMEGVSVEVNPSEEVPALEPLAGTGTPPRLRLVSLPDDRQDGAGVRGEVAKSLDNPDSVPTPESLPALADKLPSYGDGFHKCMKTCEPDEGLDVDAVPLELTLSRPSSDSEGSTVSPKGSTDLTPYSFVVKVPRGCSLHPNVPHVHVFAAGSSDVGISRYRTLSQVRDGVDTNRKLESDGTVSADSTSVGSMSLLVRTDGKSDSASGEVTGLSPSRSHSWPPTSYVRSSNSSTDYDWSQVARTLLGSLDPQQSTAGH